MGEGSALGTRMRRACMLDGRGVSAGREKIHRSLGGRLGRPDPTRSLPSTDGVKRFTEAVDEPHAPNQDSRGSPHYMAAINDLQMVTS